MIYCCGSGVDDSWVEAAKSLVFPLPRLLMKSCLAKLNNSGKFLCRPIKKFSQRCHSRFSRLYSFQFICLILRTKSSSLCTEINLISSGMQSGHDINFSELQTGRNHGWKKLSFKWWLHERGLFDNSISDFDRRRCIYGSFQFRQAAASSRGFDYWRCFRR